mmetsp:Transcript_18777/g.43332  ORF Transcript_18777/g.43332 Transcript_18777/m.43332 type:complete len:98 (-) Transcript_18777:216-509(-)
MWCSGCDSSLKVEAQKMNERSLESACAARKCEVCVWALPSFMNMKNWGITVTDSKYSANAQAMSEGQKLFKCGCKINEMTAVGATMYRWLNTSVSAL